LISNKTRFNAHFKAEFETSDLADNLEICGDNGQLLGQSFFGRIEVQHVFNFSLYLTNGAINATYNLFHNKRHVLVCKQNIVSLIVLGLASSTPFFFKRPGVNHQ